MTNDELNRQCAEALGYKFDYVEGMYRVFDPQGMLVGSSRLSDSIAACDLPDFLTSESANAMLLESMPRVTLSHYAQADEWDCSPDYMMVPPLHFEDADRKTAVVNAFIAFIQAGGKVNG